MLSGNGMLTVGGLEWKIGMNAMEYLGTEQANRLEKLTLYFSSH